MNKVTLIGNITKELSLKTSKDGKQSYVKFVIAVNEYNFKTNEKDVDFINVIAFGKKAETISSYMKKGSKIAIEGKIKTNTYTDLEGDIKYSTDIVISNFTFLNNVSGESKAIV